MTTYPATYEAIQPTLFGLGRALFSHLPHSLPIENVRERHIIGYSSVGDEALCLSYRHRHRFHLLLSSRRACSARTACANQPFVASIPASGTCNGSRTGIRVGRGGKGEKELLRTAQNCYGWTGVPEGSSTTMWRIGRAKSFVDEFHTGRPTKILEWGSESEILNIWSTIEL